jgi:hypothetical protein
MSVGTLHILDQLVTRVLASEETYAERIRGGDEKAPLPPPPVDYSSYWYTALRKTKYFPEDKFFASRPLIYFRIHENHGNDKYFYLKAIQGTLMVEFSSLSSRKYIKNITVSSDDVELQQSTVDFVFDGFWKVVSDKSDVLNNIPVPSLNGRSLTFFCYLLPSKARGQQEIQKVGDIQRKVVVTLRDGEEF